MNDDILSGDWRETRSLVREWWGRLTNDDLERIDGSKDRLVSFVERKYGYSREQAEREVDRHLRNAQR